MRRRLALAVREEVERRKRRLRHHHLRRPAHPPGRHPGATRCGDRRPAPACASATGWRWSTSSRTPTRCSGRSCAGPSAEPGARATLVLIGDPKQAIYAFRGADVHAYLDAARHAGTRATLGVNWRSDQGLSTPTTPCAAAPGWATTTSSTAPCGRRRPTASPGLVGAPDTAPLRVRIVERADGVVDLSPKGFAAGPSTLAHVAGDLAGDVVELLGGKAELVERAAGRVRDGPRAPAARARGRARAHPPPRRAGARRPRRPRRARRPQRRRQRVRHGRRPRLARAARSAGATLGAEPGPRRGPHAVHRLGRARGWPGADDAGWEDVYARLHRWAGVLRRRRRRRPRRGDHAAPSGLPARLLARPDGERSSPTCATSASWSTSRRSTTGSGVSARWRLAAPAHRRGRRGRPRRGPRPAGWSPTPRPCRC